MASVVLRGLKAVFQASNRAFKDRFDLDSRDSRKPGQKIVDGRSTFKILKQRDNRNARSSEHPGSADLFRVALNGQA